VLFNQQSGEFTSALAAGDGAIMQADPEAEADQIARLTAWRGARDEVAVQKALAALRDACASGANVMPASIAAAKAGATTGEWGSAVRAAFGQYRGPTGVSASPSNRTEGLEPVREAVAGIAARLGRPPRLLVGKPGLDGHSNGAEQIAARARDCGMAIHYEGIRLTPAEIVAAAGTQGADVVGLSILSGSHVALVSETLERMRAAGLGHIPVIVGGIIPEDDAAKLRAMGVAAVYTPKDFELNVIMMDIVALLDTAAVAAE
jgi:(2R)-ethylmalonyl-CoA mutase